ncbi:MAG TPA: hypothetical protein VKU82_01825 [Planctomycetaceae bacterium]|nr:hypothetical protein [Planctomycetaceae bacterium]
MAVSFLAGCSKSSGGSPSADDQESEHEVAQTEHAGGPASKDSKKPASKKKSAKTKGAHIGEIPLDAWPEVWFKDPLAIAGERSPQPPAQGAADSQEEAPSAPSADSDSGRVAKADSGPGATAGNTGSEWASLISGEAITDETKAIRSSLTDKLQNVGRYSSTYKDLRIDASVLTALAGVAIEHPEAPKWKSNAKYIRDVSSQVASESKANGDKFFKKARAAYDKLDALLSGSKPLDVEEAAESVKFSEVANRYYLMERMRRTTNWMKTSVNSEAVFSKESTRLSHEASVLALLAKIVASPDYPDSDVDDYRNFAASVSRSGLDMGEAVKNQDFKAYAAALDRCLKACNDCHSAFKNN